MRMKLSSRLLALLLVALVMPAALASVDFEEYGAAEERTLAIEEALREAKAASKARLEAASVQSEAEKEGIYTSSQLLSKFFKRPSAEAKELGEAQLLYEQAVHRAERKLSDYRRRSLAASQGTKEKAEVIAQELFHKPGTLLSQQELAHMWQESGCPRPMPKCTSPTVNQFRQINGVCNNKLNPLYGATGTPFRRLTPPVYEDGVSSLRGTLQARKELLAAGPFSPPNPSARLISETVIQDISMEELPFSYLLMQWGQFLDHDLDLSPELEAECEGCKVTEVCEPIRVRDDDKKFGVNTLNKADCLPLRRSLPVCDPKLPLSFEPREQVNDVTSFIDGSMVYGSRLKIATRLRLLKDGLLRTGPNYPGSQPTLPVDVDDIVACMNRMDCFLCGDVRCNEQISLTLIHTLWLREHNRCARELAQINPHWDDERLYQECRAIVGALIQKITYVDYLPKVFGPSAFDFFVGGYQGYKPLVDASVPNAFATAAYRYGHSLVRPKFDRLDANFRPLGIGPLNLVDAFFNPDQFRKSLGTDPIVRGWSATNALRMDEFVNSVLTSQLFQTKASPGMDLASLNIQRGRDHGLAPYPTWREFCNRKFKKVSNFENALTVVRFFQVYGSLETLDLWVGGLSEERVPGSLLGATFACIFGLTFQAVRDGDRFWYERDIQFSNQQRNEIKKGSMSRIICDNSDNIRSIQPDAFLTNQTRLPCTKIQRVNLKAWKESVCYFRIRVQRRLSNIRVDALSRSITKKFIMTSSTVRGGRARSSFACVQMQCPTRRSPTSIVVYSKRSLSISQHVSLPTSVEKNDPLMYRASWPRSRLTAGRSGLFSSLGQCRSSSQVALTFGRGREAQSEDEELVTQLEDELVTLSEDEDELVTLSEDEDELVTQSEDEDELVTQSEDDEELVTQSEDEDTVSQSEDGVFELSDAMIEYLDSENPNADAEPDSSQTGGGLVQEVSDQELLQELEDALDSLQ